jgi:hypothetical protein
MFGIILACGYAVIFLFLIGRWNFFRTEGISGKAIQLVFILKLIAGTFLWWIYTHIYPDRLSADIFKYFDDGKIMYDALFVKPLDYFKMLFGIQDASLMHYYLEDMRHWVRPFNQGLYDENRTLIRFNALICLFSFGNYHVHTVFMCFLSLVGLNGIYKTFLPYLWNKKKELFAIVFLLPSVLFWGSGVLKEGLILFAMGMFIYHWHKLISEKFSLVRIIFVLLFAGLLSITKIYVLAILFPACIAYTWLVKTKYKFPEIKFLVVLIVYILGGIFLLGIDIPFMLMEKQRQTINIARGGSYLGDEKSERFVYIGPEIQNRIIRLKDKPGYCKIVPGVSYISWNLKTHLDTLYVKHSSDTNTYWIYYDQSAAGSAIEIPVLDGTFFSIIKNSPVAFFNTAFRPHIFEIKNPLMFLSGIENFFVLLFILLYIFFFRIERKNIGLIYFCATIVILLFVLIGLTTPILGAVVRYKIPALPFFLMLFLLVLDKKKLLRKFRVA